MGKTKEWIMEHSENGDLFRFQPTPPQDEPTKSQVDMIGEYFTEFVNRNYDSLKQNYTLNVELEQYVSFPVFCYIEFSLMFNKDNGSGLS